MQLQPNRIRNHLFVALDHTSVITEPAVYYVLMPVKCFNDTRFPSARLYAWPLL